jgi:Flp pilus assembly protein TadG
MRKSKHLRRGAAMIEDALAMMVFAVLVAGIMELGFTGLVANTVSFAAQRAARYASVRGSSSGHVAAAPDVQAAAVQYATPLNSSALTITVTWAPNNNPGSTVKVQVAFALLPSLMPIARSGLTLKATACQTIVQ